VVCEVTYTKAWEGGNGFGGNITIRNAGVGGADLINGWSLTFTFPGNQRVGQGWSANWSQPAGSANVTATNLSWNGSLPAGASTGIGFNGSFSGTNANPTNFAINGVACNGQPPPQQSLVVAPTAVTVPEGGTATYGVSLGTQPASNVTVTSTAGTGDTNLTVSGGGSLTFTPSNWNTPQNVTVAAAQDADTTDGTRPITVASAGLTAVTVTATEDDDDSPQQTQAIQPTATTVRVPEGSTATVGVRLAIAPAGNVVVNAAAGAGDTNITVTGGASLTFTPTNFATPQNVTLSAAQDADDVDGTRTITLSATGIPSVAVTATEGDDESTENAYLTEFIEQYDKLKDPASGYFSPEGVPYHSVETLLVEAPDHGHETTSEAMSFYIWLEAQYGRVTENWAPFNTAWNVMEQFIIPSAAGQPGGSAGYNPADPADYAPEFNQPSQYPSPLSSSVVAGQDPLAAELQSTYGNRNMYAMHWLLDVDDVYGFGRGTGNRCGDTTQRVTYINTYQRGPQESVWETVPHPSCETQQYGQSGQGFPPLFIQGQAAAQWRYTAAPDADARAVQAAYWANVWATEQGNQSQISATLTKAAKLGDYLRYAMYDKYFKNPGCATPTCAAGSGKSSSAYLLNWYFAWGGDTGGQWSWRIGSSHNHGGYQNPLAAWVLSPAGPTALRPQSPTAAADWNTSLTRQVQFYAWLQSAEGAIAGGATNSWDGAYAARPSGAPQFFGMSYDVDPVYHDPPSNQWFGFQAWGMQRLAELYYVTGNTLAKQVLDRWVAWAISQTSLGTGSTFSFPSDMSWTGAPSASFNSATGTPAANPGLHVTVINRANDVGVGAAYARTLIYYAARENGSTLGTSARNTAKGLLDRMLMLKDSRGITVTETRGDYERFNDVWTSANQKGLYVPPGFTGTMPNGDPVNSSSTFLSIRSFYEDDPEWAKVQNHLNGGPAPTFNYHRFWAQADIAMALADYGSLFPSG
jgi:hypothetical protein